MCPERAIVGRSFLVLAALLVGAAHAAAPQISLTLSQTPNVFPAPGAADYNAGILASPTGIVYTLSVTGGPASTRHTATVSIRASGASLGNGKPLSDLEWARADQPTSWHPMSITDAVVESRQMQRNRLNDPWSNTLFLRVHLAWANDAPATYGTGLLVTLTVTTP